MGMEFKDIIMLSCFKEVSVWNVSRVTLEEYNISYIVF